MTDNVSTMGVVRKAKRKSHELGSFRIGPDRSLASGGNEAERPLCSPTEEPPLRS